MSGKNSNKSGLRPFTKENPPTPEMIEKRSETRKRKGQFREKALIMLENDKQVVTRRNVLYFLDKSGKKLKPSDTIDKIYEVVFEQPTYDTIIQKMIEQAVEGDHQARKQLIELVEGYREKEVEKDESFKDFLDNITVAWNPGPDYVPYEEMGRTPE